MLGIALVSAVVNLLALTGPLFMLQVYDRVLASRSLPTLAGLALLAGGLYAFQALLDILRARILVRLGERFEEAFARRVHEVVVRLPLVARMAGDGLQPLRDLDNVRGFLAGQGPAAFCDLPWIPLYLGICFVFHVWLGVTALAGALILAGLTLLTGLLSRRLAQEAVVRGMTRNALLDAARRNAEVVRAMGLEVRMAERWEEANRAYLAADRQAADIAGGLGGLSRTLRLVLQSAMLAVGAWLVIAQEATAGVMIASSIMMGRAMAPVDLAIGNWKGFLTARQSWTRLREAFALVPPAGPVTQLPPPQRECRVEAVSVVPPGGQAPTLLDVGFLVQAGSAVAVIGASGSGKSTLARILAGVWRPQRGTVRLDGATFDQWDRTRLGAHIGYLPQDVALFDGTIAENIARFAADADPAAVIAAAQAAGVHDLILRLPDGYETRVGEGGSALSAGQRQRVGLARALYGDPFLIVLDEPNANLDAEGEAALGKALAAVRARHGIAVVIAHRPSVLNAVDQVLMLEAGRIKAFGPRDEVLAKVLKKPAFAAAPTARSLAPLRVVAEAAGPSREVADG